MAAKDQQQAVARKWKGKDWYAILAPKMFGEVQVAESPATDPKHMIGRTIEVSAAEIFGQNPKPHMKVCFKITSLDGKNAHTEFSGFEVVKDFMFRMVRKRTSKLNIIGEAETKDKWKLQITTVTVLNRKAEEEVTKKVRKFVETFLKDFAGKASLEDFIKAVIEEAVQQHVKKLGSKIYPVRFNEITKIEVLKSPVA